MKRRGYIHRSPWYARRFGTNVHPAERWLSLLGALGLTAFGRRSPRNRSLAAVAAGFFLRRGLTGSCPLYRRFGLSSV